MEKLLIAPSLDAVFWLVWEVEKGVVLESLARSGQHFLCWRGYESDFFRAGMAARKVFCLLVRL